MNIDREQWARLSALLDSALDMDAADRVGWVDGLAAQDAGLAEQLRRLLAQDARRETADFLKPPDLLGALRHGVAQSGNARGDLQAGGKVGSYRLIRELGRGGMGSVWLAERIAGGVQRQVALKFPYTGAYFSQFADRVERERDILGRLEHPNIARLYDADVTGQGQPFLVLEFVAGEPINEFADRHHLNLRERLDLFLQVLLAVQFAHSRLVIHRDLKPSNILITADRTARLLDFGIAKLMTAGPEDSALTRFGGRLLTPAYASPEQVNSEPITTASDIYSLGVVLYELLTGSKPYRPRRNSEAAWEDAIAQAQIIVPSQAALSADAARSRGFSSARLARTLRGDLDAIVLKALSRQPEARYASADALAQDLRHWLNQEPVQAQRPGAWSVLNKLIRRHRLIFAASTAVVLSLVSGAGLALWQARTALAQTERLQATKSFLLDVFNVNSIEQTDPLKAQQTTARELLDHAYDRLSAKPHAASDSMEEMLGVLGGLYHDMGLDEKSAALGQQRMVMARQLFGPDDLRTAAAEVDYAGSLYDMHDWKLTLAPLQDAERILDRHGDNSSYTRARELGNMAQYWGTRNYTRAKAYASRALALERKRYPDSLQFIEDLHTAADIENTIGNRAAAVPLLQEALSIQESSATAQIHLILPLTQLAESQGLELQDVAAEANFRRALELSHRLNGELSVDSIQVGLRYAKFLRGVGRLRESQQLLQRSEHNAVQLLGDDESFHLPTLRDQLAQTEQALGDFPAAALLLQKALRTREAGRPGGRQHANILTNYAALQIDTGHPDEAQQLLTRAITYFEQASVPVGASDVPVTLAAALSAQGQHAQALKALDLYADGREFVTRNMQIELEMRRAAEQWALGQTEAAEALVRRQLTLVMAMPLREHRHLTEAAVRGQLGEMLLQKKQAAEARTQLQTCLDWLRESAQQNSPLIARYEALLGQAALALGDRAAALGLLQQSQVAMAASPELAAYYRDPLMQLSQDIGQGQ